MEYGSTGTSPGYIFGSLSAGLVDDDWGDEAVTYRTFQHGPVRDACAFADTEPGDMLP